MTPQEELQILELHTKWGNRWSKIAKKLPGRTDNEIKNYWRTLMRKKSQEKRRVLSPSPSMSNSSAYSSVDSTHMTGTKERSFYDTGGLEMVTMKYGKSNNYKKKTTAASENSTIDRKDVYNSMDEIWKDITLLDDNDDGVTSIFGSYNAITLSSIWDYPLNTLSMIDGQEEMGTGKQHVFSNLAQG